MAGGDGRGRARPPPALCFLAACASGARSDLKRALLATLARDSEAAVPGVLLEVDDQEHGSSSPRPARSRGARLVGNRLGMPWPWPRESCP